MKRERLTYEIFETALSTDLYLFAVDGRGVPVWGKRKSKVDNKDGWIARSVSVDWSEIIDFHADPRAEKWRGLPASEVDSAHSRCVNDPEITLIASTAWEAGLPFGIDTSACRVLGHLFALEIGAETCCPECGHLEPAVIGSLGLIEHPAVCSSCGANLKA